MASQFRVVFDTNAFTASAFDGLDGSRMRKLCRSGRVVPLYGHVFLEETLRAYGIQTKRDDLVQRWLPFAVETVDRFCDDLTNIFQKEVVQGRGLKTNIYMRPRDQKKLIASLGNVPLDGAWSAWRRSKGERDIGRAMRDTQREISTGIRREIADWKEAVNYNQRTHDVISLRRYLEREVDHAGRQFLPAVVRCKEPSAVADRWAKAKMCYPYFTTFVLNMLYIAYHAMTKPNDKIDINAQADLNLMTHLLHADALVSNETGFLRQAFMDLWRPRGKIIFTSQEFVDFLEVLP